jgi:hypothetical protein
MKLNVIKVKNIERLRRMMNNDSEINNLFEDVSSNFYEFDFYEKDRLNYIEKVGSEDGYDVLVLMRVFWRLMNDLDKECKGYDVIEWNIENYYNFFIDNIDKVDLNKKCYRMYFKDMVFYMLKSLSSKK